MRLIMNNGHEFVIYGRLVRAGEEFDVPEDEARTWKLMKRARDASVQTKNMTADLPADSSEPQVKRRYNRRDMRAEE